MMKLWETLSRKTVSSHPPWLELERHKIALPNGERIEDWMWVQTPDFVNVAVVDPEGNYHCFRQQKYAVPKITLAVVGGYVDEGETPIKAAHRELEEEMGFRSAEMTSLGNYIMDGNRGCGTGHLFLAENCTQNGTSVADDLEDQEHIVLTPDKLKEALLQGKFGVASWTATLALALLARGKVGN
jgi:ADP-ribose pyrophosphatase